MPQQTEAGRAEECDGDYVVRQTCWENMPSFVELYVYLVALLCGISMMMPVNAVFSAPSYMLQYYKYAMNDEFAVPVNTNFWDNVLTYYNLISMTTSVIIDPWTLTQQFRRIPILSRLLAGLLTLIVEIILLMGVPAVGTSETGAVVTICFAAFIGGLGDSIFSPTVYGMFGAFPPSYMSTMMGGVGISGVLTSLIQIIVKAALPQDFESVKLQAKIYYGLDVGIQGFTCVCLLLLPLNSVACMYLADLISRKKDDDAVTVTVLRTVQDERRGEDSENDPEGLKTVGVTSALAVERGGSSGYASQQQQQQQDGESLVEDLMSTDESTRCAEGNTELAATDVLSTLGKIMWMAIACAFNFGITLMLFPTIVVTADSADYWYGTIAVFMFNIFDACGRFTPTFKATWPKTYDQRWFIVLGSFARVIFVPLLLMYSCHLITGHAFGYIMMIIFGYSNGYIGSMCLVLAPKSKGIVGDGQRFVAATMTGISIVVGGMVGSAICILIQAVRGVGSH